MTRRHSLVLGLAALLFIAAHSLTVPVTLEDEDSVNLALGVESFDIRRYAPHPPGYPVYVALGKVSTAIVGAIRPDWSRDQRAAAGLAWLSILSGAAGLFAIALFWRALDVPPWWAVAAAIGTGVAPLYWFTAARPLTDTPGLTAAIAVQAATLHLLLRSDADTVGRRWTPWALIGLAAGLSIGLRSQTMWMTLPVLAVAFTWLLTHQRYQASLALPAGGFIGTLLWFVPMITLTGGWTEYFAVLRGQGQHDFSGVEMLATNPSWQLLQADLAQTFVSPWLLTGVPMAISLAALAGLLRVYRWTPAAPVWLAVATIPYLIFHLLFHEVETVRYALPTVVIIGGLATLALRWVGQATGAIAVVGVAAAGVSAIQPVTAAYAHGAPVFLTLREMQRAAEQQQTTPQIEAHHRAWWATSRALDWIRTEWPITLPRLIDRDESLRLVDYWRTGATAPIWFLSDPDRGDLARFDPRASTWQATRRLHPATIPLIAGLRTYDVGWWQLEQPSWMLGRGWSLSPELANEPGESTQAVAYLRRDAHPTVLFVGSRYDAAAQAPVDVVASVDGIDVDQWTMMPGDRITRWMTVPGTRAIDSPYATLSLRVSEDRPVPGRLLVFDQFDAVSGSSPLLALGDGWGRSEADTRPRKRAHRTTALSEVEVRHAGRPVRITLRGNVPGDAQAPPTVVISAGATLLARVVATSEFEHSFTILPEALDASGGLITIAVDVRATGGRGLRIHDIRIEDAGTS